MATSKQVFALRKEGKIEEAYQMALTCILIDSEDEWNIKALAYCLYDKIKLAKESRLCSWSKPITATRKSLRRI